jgi:uridine kinase
MTPRRDAAAVTATRHMVADAICIAVSSKRGTVLVAVDGRGGAGKSTLAAWLGERLEATVLHTDDFASGGAKGWWWEPFREDVLAPLSRDEPGRCTMRDWNTGEPGDTRTVPPGGVVILEGVSASRRELGDHWDVTVWVDCPADVRISRGLARDGEAALDDWMRWEAEEEAHFTDQRSFERAHFVVDGLEEC